MLYYVYGVQCTVVHNLQVYNVSVLSTVQCKV